MTVGELALVADGVRERERKEWDRVAQLAVWILRTGFGNKKITFKKLLGRDLSTKPRYTKKELQQIKQANIERAEELSKWAQR